jgi:hypothetical protein
VSRAFPGIFGNQAERLTEIIHRIFLNCLNDAESKVRYTAATALAAYLKQYADNAQLLNVYRDCLTCFVAVSARTGATYDRHRSHSVVVSRRSGTVWPIPTTTPCSRR